MPISPGQYDQVPPYDLLSAAARGHLAFDQRLLRALTADPARTLPDLIRFSQEDRSQDRIELSIDLLHLFAVMPSPEAVPLLVAAIRSYPDDAPMELLELAVRLGDSVTTPLLDLFDETGRAHSEIVFVALTAGARGPRMDDAIAAIEAADPDDAALLREIAATTYQPEILEGGAQYPAEADPDLSALPEDEREEFLLCDSAEFRAMVAASYVGEELTDRRRQQFLDLGSSDPDARVRGLCWEALREQTDQPLIRQALAARLPLATDPVERAALANALAYHVEIEGVADAIEAAYAEPAHRAKALEAMWRSLDRRWSDRPARHLDDPDLAVQRHAVLATGYFQLRNETPRLEPLFADPDLREDAIYAYALAAPAEETSVGIRQLEKRIAGLAGGLSEEDAEALEDALETRLAMSGKRRAAAAQPTALPAAAAAAGSPSKIGRNDPCLCGSGKKFKKCCGSAA